MSNKIVLAGAAYGAGRGLHYLKRKYWDKQIVPYQTRSSRGFNTRVKRIILRGAENKFLDTVINSVVPVAGTSVIQLLTGVAIGDEDDDREGNVINISKIELNGVIQTDANEPIATWCRVMIIRAKKNVNGVLPVITDFLTADVVNALNSKNNVRNKEFTRVYDRIFAIQPQGALIADVHRQTSPPFIFSKSWKTGIKATFGATGATITAVEKNSMYVVIMCNNSASFNPQFQIRIRITYKDL